VTGGASGLGRATAEHLVGQGAHVVIVDLPTSGGEAVAAEIDVDFAPADVTDADQLLAAFATAEQRGPLRSVVHCAGRGGDGLRILSRDGDPSPLDSFENLIRLNLSGTYNVLRIAASRIARNEDLLDGDRGAIVLTASAAAFEGQVGQTSYAAAKSGVRGLTLVAARDLASWGIRVNTIAPGTFETPMLLRFPQEALDKLAAQVPYPKRLGRPDEYAQMAVQLLKNGFMNGETVRLDGAIRMAPR
jgi:NAD(P)-dependent dehydrogenase (short-subunit alcohol dehydrogenase family)